MSILAGITAGAGLIGGIASSIIGGNKAAEAARKQQQAIYNQKAKDEAWYNRNYYGNYMDSKESQAALKRVEDTLRRRNQEAQAQGAVSGATPEAVVAQQANDQQLMTDVVSNLASKSDDIKRNVDAQNQANQRNTFGMEMQQYQANESGGSQLLASGGGLIATALSGLDSFGNKAKK